MRTENLVLAASGLLVVVGVPLYLSRRVPEPATPLETPAQTRADLEAAFADEAPPPNEVARIRVFFDRLKKARAAQDERRTSELFDFDLFTGAVRRLSGPAGMDDAKLRAFVEGMKQSVPRAMARHAVVGNWVKLDLRKVEYAAGGEEATVYTRHRDASGLDGKMRWWLTRRSGEWRLYDFEDLDGSLRFSMLTSVAFQWGGGTINPRFRAMRTLISAGTHMRSGDFEAIGRILDQVRDQEFPDQLEELRHLLLASVRLAQQRYDEALRAIQVARTYGDGMPVLHHLEAAALNGLGRYPEALAAADRYANLLGSDAQLYQLRGDAYSGLGWRADAAEQYRAGIRDNPKWLDNLYGLGLVLPPGKKGELRSLCVRIQLDQDAFATLARGFLDTGDLESLQEFTAGFRELHPDNPHGHFYAGALAFRLRRFDAAAEGFFHSFRGLKPGPEQESVIQDYLRAMVAGGKPLPAYLATPNRPMAFRVLSALLAGQGKMALLESLVREHARGFPKDPWIHYFRGVGHHVAKRYDEADKELVAAIQGAGSDENYEAFRIERVNILYKAGKSLHALESVPPADRTFGQLAGMYGYDRDADGMAKLLAQRAKEAPRDPTLVFWRAELAGVRGDYAAVIDLYDRGRRAIKDPEQNWRFFDHFLRCLVRLKRFERAEREAEGYLHSAGEPFYLTLCYAAKGDAKQTAQWIRKCLTRGHSVAGLYDDKDFGPALRTAALRDVRAQFPRTLPNR